MKDGKINDYEAKKIFKTLEDMEGSEIDYSKLVYRSDDNEYFDFTRFGPLSSVYLKLVNGNIGINVVKLTLKEFKSGMNSRKRKKTMNQSYKLNKKHTLENAEALYNGLNIIMDAFKNPIFERVKSSSN